MKASLTTLAICLALASFGNAQSTSSDQKPADQTAAAPAAAQPAAAAPAAPTPLSSPSMTGPLSNLPPFVFDAGPAGNLSVNGVVSGMGMLQTNHAVGDNPGNAALTNGQIIIQKADGLVQFYLQAGAYDIPVLGAPYLSTEKSLGDLFGAVPVGYLKLAGKTTSFEIGALPTLIGAEYAFTFENMNIERGLLWNLEPAISKGIQLNQTLGKFTLALSWNDGFYSNRYNWLTGSLAYTKGAHALSFVAGGNYGKTAYSTFAAPANLNNSSIYNVIYTYTKGAWVFNPYYQYTDSPTDASVGIVKGASTSGGAVLVSRTFNAGLSVGVRYEYVASSGSFANNSVNLLFGPGSAGESVTVTPTYQKGGFFGRAEASWVHANDMVQGYAFGTEGKAPNQLRAVIEMGFIFGDNVVKKK